MNQPDDTTELDLAWADAGRAIGRALRLTLEATSVPDKPRALLRDDALASLPLTLHVPDVAKAIGASRAAVYELVRRREIRSVRVGRRIVIPRAAVMEFLDRGLAT